MYVILLSLVHYGFFSSPRAKIVENGLDRAQLNSVVKGRLLVILVDASRSENMFSDAYMPFVNAMRSHSAWGYSHVSSFPMSIAGDHAIFEGNIDSLLSIKDDFNPAPSRHENLFGRLHQEGKRIVLAGDLIHLTYGKYAINKDYHRLSRSFVDCKGDAAAVFDYAYHALRSKHWDVSVVQFVSLDHLGHLETPSSPNNRALYRDIDGYIERLVSLTDKNDTILITAEHGIDKRGFHIDRSPSVIETPFVLVGPHVQYRAKPYHVLQIDWAPTLSILGGVNPVYPNDAMPSLNFLRLPHPYATNLMRVFSDHLNQGTAPLSFSELRDIRDASLGVATHGSHRHAIIILVFLFSALMLTILLCQTGICGGIACCAMVVVGVMGSGYLVFVHRAYACLEMLPPFSANYMMAHVSHVMAYVLSCVLVGRVLRACSGVLAHDRMRPVAYAMLSLMFSMVFLSQNIYAVFGWAMIGIPLFMYGFTACRSWVFLFGALWAGLFIRRLTYLEAYGHFHMPGQWIYAAIMLVLVYAICHDHRLRDDRYPGPVLATGALLPSLAIILARPDATHSAALLMLSAIPVAMAAKRMVRIRSVVWAAWVAMYGLGTSGSIDHLTRIVLFPMLLLVWPYLRQTTSAIRALLYLWVVWAIYMMAGNTFDIRLSELTDPYIMETLTSSGVIYTVLLIVSRYLVPIAILIGLSVDGEGHDQGRAALSMTLFPLMLGAVAVLMSLLLSGTSSYPWQDEIRIVFISIAMFLVLFSFLSGRLLNASGLWGHGSAAGNRA